eukprot:2604843-Rhodomonas_salina.1
MAGVDTFFLSPKLFFCFPFLSTSTVFLNPPARPTDTHTHTHLMSPLACGVQCTPHAHAESHPPASGLGRGKSQPRAESHSL